MRPISYYIAQIPERLTPSYVPEHLHKPRFDQFIEQRQHVLAVINEFFRPR